MLIFAASCSVVVDADRRQCRTVADCGRADAVCVTGVCERAPIVPDASIDSAPEDPAWGCVGKVGQLPVEEPNVPLMLYSQFVGAINPAPVSGIASRACLQDDDACDNPVPGSERTTDADGLIATPVYPGYRGYLDLRATDASVPIIPTLSFIPALDKNLPRENPPATAIPLFTRDDIEIIVSAISREVDPRLGLFFFTVRDCQGKVVAGAQVRVEPITAQTFSFYTDQTGTPSLTQQQTSGDGTGGYLNLPPGRIRVTVTRSGGIAAGTAELIIREGSLSDTYLDPLR